MLVDVNKLFVFSSVLKQNTIFFSFLSSLLNGRKNSNFFKIAVWQSDSMKRKYGGIWDLHLILVFTIGLLSPKRMSNGRKIRIVKILFWFMSLEICITIIEIPFEMQLPLYTYQLKVSSFQNVLLVSSFGQKTNEIISGFLS